MNSIIMYLQTRIAGNKFASFCTFSCRRTTDRLQLDAASPWWIGGQKTSNANCCQTNHLGASIFLKIRETYFHDRTVQFVRRGVAKEWCGGVSPAPIFFQVGTLVGILAYRGNSNLKKFSKKRWTIFYRMPSDIFKSLG